MKFKIKEIIEDIRLNQEKGYYIVHTIKSFSTLITDGRILIYSDQSGLENLKLLNLNKGHSFKFDGIEYNADLDTLKTIEILIYGDNLNYYINGSLDNLLF